MLREPTTSNRRALMTVLMVAGALVVFPVAVAATDAPPPDPEAEINSPNSDFSEIVDEGFTFRWRIDGDEIEAIMSAPTTGYVAVGFHPTRMKLDAEIVIGFVEDGTAHVQHHYATAPVSHESLEDLGEQSHVTVVDASEEDGVTTIHFRLPLSYGGEYDQPLIPGELTPVIWAYGPDDANNFADYHGGSAGSFEIEL